MNTPFTPLLETLTRLKGVTACLVVASEDGIAVDSTLQFGQDGNRVSALAASLYRKAGQSAAAAGLGTTGFMQLEADEGRLCILGGADLVLVVVADRDANVGLIRVEMRKAAPQLS